MINEIDLDINNSEYSFPPVSDKFIEGHNESYLWTAKYLRFRKHQENPALQEINAELNRLEQPSTNLSHSFRGCLLGAAVGDALGTTNEFKARNSFTPIEDLTGEGPFDLKAGEWTDDTSMSYALGQSLLYRNGFDAKDQMLKYLAWWKHGSFSCTGTCFDIGNTVKSALESFEKTENPYSGSTDPLTAGNGSLMRIAPIALYYQNDPEKAIHFASESSKTTHGAQESVSACQYFTGLLIGATNEASKESLLQYYCPTPDIWNKYELPEKIKSIATGAFLKKTIDSISTSGYVIDTLEAALWCFANTSSYKEGALLAANLGGDADTIAAIYGQLAGAFYGEPNIPAKWIQKLSHFHIFYKQAHDFLKDKAM